MYSVEISSIKLEFEPAIIKVPESGLDYDWLNDCWIEETHKIEVTQKPDFALIKGLSGYGAELGESKVELIKPELYSENCVKTYLQEFAEKRGHAVEVSGKAISFKEYNWGTLISLQWHELGYAPGGSEYIVLPNRLSALYFGFVPINWSSLVIKNV